jgi:AcrR family transcriptional regulator
MANVSRGRPRTSSIGALEEAAAELFLEQGYSHTTVDDIASRAGVSRATFFNYFHSKSDVLWVDVDRVIDQLLVKVAASQPLGDALRAIAYDSPAQAVPLIASQHEVMETNLDIPHDAGQRVIALAQAVALSGLPPQDVWIVTGALVSAALEWASAGVNREVFAHYLAQNLDRIESIVDVLSARLLF